MSSRFVFVLWAFVTVLVLGAPQAVRAQEMNEIGYDLESLDAEIAAPSNEDICAKFSPELQKLAGCNDNETDPSLEGVDDPAALANDAGLAGPSPYDPVDPSADMVNGLSGGGGGADAFGMAIDDLTGGLVTGDMP